MTAPLLANKGDTAPDFEEISRDQTADQGHSITELSERNVDSAIKSAYDAGDGTESKTLHNIKISKSYGGSDKTYEMGKEQHKGEIGMIWLYTKI